jgi:5-dehydro-2-deoxygluconokinase
MAPRSSTRVVGRHRGRKTRRSGGGHAEELGVRTLVLKRGEHGATPMHDGKSTDVESHLVDVVDELGAGDAFVAAFVQSLHAGRSLEEAAHHGSVAGAITASQLACSEAVPRLNELETVLA